MRRLRVALGVICLLMGGVWILQGTGIVPGSFMTGQGLWLGIGLVVGVLGLFLAYSGLRRPPGSG